LIVALAIDPFATTAKEKSALERCAPPIKTEGDCSVFKLVADKRRHSQERDAVIVRNEGM
jgi:hypothetical protein